jgi:hypothetical protein
MASDWMAGTNDWLATGIRMDGRDDEWLASANGIRMDGRDDEWLASANGIRMDDQDERLVSFG